MSSDNFGARNGIGKVQPQGMTPSEWEQDETCLTDTWSKTAHYRWLTRDAEAAQNNDDAGDASNAASRTGYYTDNSMGGGGSAYLGGTASGLFIGTAPAARDAEIAAAVDMLEPMSANDGKFEVSMPNGQKFGVTVSTTAEHVAFFLSSPNCRALGNRFKRHKTTMEDRLAGRLGKLVKLTVL